MQTLSRIWTFTQFTFAEYVRSGRIMVELVATVLFWGLFLRQYPVGLDQFFSLTGIFTLLMALYTTASLLSLGERAQGYPVLTRPLGRSGYLISLYLVAIIVVVIMFILVTGLTLIFNRPLDLIGSTVGFMLSELGKGTLPLLLNISLIAALMVLLSSLVLTNALRLVLLAILAIALYSQAWHLSPIFPYIQPLQSIFSWPIYPAIAGFRLAATREFGGNAPYILLAQLALAVLLMSLAISSFKRRDIILRSS